MKPKGFESLPVVLFLCAITQVMLVVAHFVAERKKTLVATHQIQTRLQDWHRSFPNHSSEVFEFTFESGRKVPPLAPRRHRAHIDFGTPDFIK